MSAIGRYHYRSRLLQMFREISTFKSSAKFTGKNTFAGVSFLINSVKKRLWRGCFPINCDCVSEELFKYGNTSKCGYCCYPSAIIMRRWFLMLKMTPVSENLGLELWSWQLIFTMFLLHSF